MFDYLIKNGCMVDGSGSAARRTDIAILDGRIADIGLPGDASAAAVIDAEGLYVAPGFIDLHSHSDFTLLLDGRAESFVRQGVTTEVIGNCGMSCAPLRNPSDLKRNVFGYLEPYTARWSSMDEYLTELEAVGLGINVAPLAGHAAIRSSVMGFEKRQASARERVLMKTLLQNCLEEGAWGLSSGLEYFPGSSASAEEIADLCGVVRGCGGLYATHVRNRDEQYQLGFQEAFDAAGKTSVRLQVSHIVPKYGAPADAAEWTLARLRSYSEQLDIGCDVIPYEWGPTTMTVLLPAELLSQDIPDIVKTLRDERGRRAIRDQDQHFWLLVRDERWDLIKLYHSRKFPHLIGKNAFEIADALATTPFDALLDILAEEDEQMFGVLMMGKIKRAGDLAEFIKYDRCGVISDGMSLSPTGRLKEMNWSPGCYGWAPRFFEDFTGKTKSLSIEQGVAKLTAWPAGRLGLTDRGLIREGNWADLVLFDMAGMSDHASMEEPSVFPDGIRWVLVNGKVAVRDGSTLPLRNGRVLRRREGGKT